MHGAQFKDLVSHMCLANTAVVSWYFTLEVVGSSPFTISNILSMNLLNSVKTFRDISDVQEVMQGQCSSCGVVVSRCVLIC